LISWLTQGLLGVRDGIEDLIYSFFPSPNAELILGLVFGSTDVKELGRFNDIMRGVGLIHVVVVSGYNINLVFDLALRLVGSKFKFLNLVVAQFAVFLYALMTGFEIPTARALIMSSALYWTRFFGYKVNPLTLLFFSAFVMLLYDRETLTNLSFQLSFAATLGLIVLGNLVTKVADRFPIPKVLAADLSATFSAQTFVLPIIYKAFGTLNLVGFLSNPVILWLVPMMTLSALIFVPLAFISPFLGSIARIPLFVLSSTFIEVSSFMFRIFSA